MCSRPGGNIEGAASLKNFHEKSPSREEKQREARKIPRQGRKKNTNRSPLRKSSKTETAKAILEADMNQYTAVIAIGEK